ncbi:hypothetical protein HanRHA438_Chr11g0525631 [Helianthus annuus]|nr:hypothetical protein HanRHA438_Chr11g0525631 [Helianthus annuus]
MVFCDGRIMVLGGRKGEEVVEETHRVEKTKPEGCMVVLLVKRSYFPSNGIFH